MRITEYLCIQMYIGYQMNLISFKHKHEYIPITYDIVFVCNRYEVEYDENRITIGKDIGRRFLGLTIDGVDGKQNSDSIMNGLDDNGSRNYVKTNQDDSNLANSTDDTIQQSGKLNRSDDCTTINQISTTTTTGIGDGKSTIQQETNSKNLTESNEINLNTDKDELVLDVLNDDLIAKVREKINGNAVNISRISVNKHKFLI